VWTRPRPDRQGARALAVLSGPPAGKLRGHRPRRRALKAGSPRPRSPFDSPQPRA
jgi:hypothetical protein